MSFQSYWNIYKYSEKKTVQNNDSFLYNPKERLNSILKKISKEKGKLLVTLLRLKEKKRKSYIYQLQHNNESDLNKITDDMGFSEREFLSRINKFKEDMIDFEKEQNRNIKKFKEVKKSNDFFSGMYEHLMESRKKKGTGILMENKFFFDIANKYLFRKYRLPDLSRNVFSPNPLILEPEELKKFFKNNEVDEKKFVDFLERMKTMTYRKITGDYRISVEEKNRLENIIKNERPKGYIPPEELIPMLKKDISETKNTYEHLINEYKSKTIEEPSNKKPIISNRTPLYDLKRINIMKKIKLIKNNNNAVINNKNQKNNNINDNNSNSLIDNRSKNNITVNINNSSIETTTIPVDTKSINIKTPRYNILNRTNSQTMILVSPLRKKLQSKTLRDIDVFKNDLENKLEQNKQKNFDPLIDVRSGKIEKDLLKKSHDFSINNLEDKSNQEIQKDLDPLFYFKSGKIGKKLLKRSFIINNPIKDKEFNLNNSSLLENNKMELFTPRPKIDFHKLISNGQIELNKEKKENKNQKDLNKIYQINLKKTNGFNSFLNKSINNNNKETPHNLDLSTKKDYFKEKMPQIIEKKYKTPKELEKERSLNIEKLYNKALKIKLKSRSFEDEYELENYLISSNGNKNLSQIMDLKNTYYNIAKMERNFLRKNLIKEEYSFRSKKGSKKIEFTENQKKILDKNDIITKIFIQRANRFRKVICEKNEVDND